MSDKPRYAFPRSLSQSQMPRHQGSLSRRGFLGRAGAIGLSALIAQGLPLGPANANVVAPGQMAGVPVRGGHLKIAHHGGDFSNTLLPAQAASPVAVFNLRSLGDTLVEIGPDGHLNMRLAEELSVSADGMAWHLRLRQGVSFHNGRPLQAEDIRALLEWHRAPENGSGALVHLLGIESIAVKGDLITIYLLQPDFCFGQGLGDVCLTVTTPDEKSGRPLFTGGYRVEHDEPGVRHQFLRHTDYWDDNRAFVDQLEILVINDPVLRAAALTSGQVHVASQIAPATAVELATLTGLRVARAERAELRGFGMQLTAQPYDNADLRRALRFAIDREGILTGVLQGHGALGNDLPSAPGLAGLQDAIPQLGYDPDQARFHYRRARVEDAPIILRVSDMAFPQAQEAAAIFKASARAADIPLEIRREDGDFYWSEVWNRQPFSAASLASAPSAALAFAGFRSGGVWNTTRFGSPLYDDGLSRLRAIADPAARAQAELDLALILHAEGGLIAPVQADVFDLHHEQVQGFVPGGGAMMGGFAGTRLWLG